MLFSSLKFHQGGSEDRRKNYLDRLEYFEFFKGVWRVGVRRLREFNFALLGKWCWRILVDRVGLWYSVLVARYGEVRGWGPELFFLVEGVGRIRDGDGGVGGSWFGDSVRSVTPRFPNVKISFI
ncbi:hypothetical protein MTR_8g102735 [Medicago truncatula]|uniref:Uncharacterized protein n=1 Tax=Medicago truncatula TaxID=3880 RepID=A0A072U681_MEDTR|nr:hypothetical protein MTR_8g102735 [Medicago truncatula]